MTRPLRNELTDIAGLAVGHAVDPDARTGVTVVVGERPFVASAFVMGGAPGTRETDLLAPEQRIDDIDALVLSGGSAFGLEAASGVAEGLHERGRGHAVGPARVPLVPAAILFDLLNGGDKTRVAAGLYRELGYRALAASGPEVGNGSLGAGFGATTTNLRGGLGTASAELATGHRVGALAAVNAVGQVTVGDTGHFWAAPFETDAEFGGLGWPSPLPATAAEIRHKIGAHERGNTTLGVVATDAPLAKGAARRLAMVAHDGLARAIWPAHTAYDGDIVFALSTGSAAGEAPPVELGAAAAACLARAVARAVHDADDGWPDGLPSWRQAFGT